MGSDEEAEGAGKAKPAKAYDAEQEQLRKAFLTAFDQVGGHQGTTKGGGVSPHR